MQYTTKDQHQGQGNWNKSFQHDWFGLKEKLRAHSLDGIYVPVCVCVFLVFSIPLFSFYLVFSSSSPSSSFSS